MSQTKKIIAEVVQFAPIITLAFSFIVKGGVDINQAGTLFVISGFCAFIITGILVFYKVMLNPILLASNLWLLAGAAAFGIPIPALADILSQTNAVLLFASALVVGIILTLVSSTGYIGMANVDKATVRRLSVLLIGLTAGVLLWSIIFKNDIRLGGGVPFIILNVTRRMLIRRTTKRWNSTLHTPASPRENLDFFGVQDGKEISRGDAEARRVDSDQDKVNR